MNLTRVVLTEAQLEGLQEVGEGQEDDSLSTDNSLRSVHCREVEKWGVTPALFSWTMNVTVFLALNVLF